jgi:hypothetical protein
VLNDIFCGLFCFVLFCFVSGFEIGRIRVGVRGEKVRVEDREGVVAVIFVVTSNLTLLLSSLLFLV